MNIIDYALHVLSSALSSYHPKDVKNLATQIEISEICKTVRIQGASKQRLLFDKSKNRLFFGLAWVYQMYQYARTYKFPYRSPELIVALYNCVKSAKTSHPNRNKNHYSMSISLPSSFLLALDGFSVILLLLLSDFPFSLGLGCKVLLAPSFWVGASSSTFSSSPAASCRS